MSKKHGTERDKEETSVDEVVGYEIISRIPHGIAGEHQNTQHISYHQHTRCDDESQVLMLFP
jgi:hypothetical protein